MSRRNPHGNRDLLGARHELPWPAMSDRDAASKLGVAVELIQGLAGGKKIESQRMTLPSGKDRLFVRKSDIDALAIKLRE